MSTSPPLTQPGSPDIVIMSPGLRVDHNDLVTPIPTLSEDNPPIVPLTPLVVNPISTPALEELLVEDLQTIELPIPTAGFTRVGALNIRGAHTPLAQNKLVLAAQLAAREGLDFLALSEIGMNRFDHRAASQQIKRETNYSLIVPNPLEPLGAPIAHHSGAALLISPLWAKNKGPPVFISDRVVAVPFYSKNQTLWVISIYQYTDPLHTNRNKAHALLQKLRQFLLQLTQARRLPLVILMGDLNEALDPDLDRLPLQGDRIRPPGEPLVQTLIAEFDLVDLFRHQHPNEPTHTFTAPGTQSRLDYILTTQTLQNRISTVQHRTIPALYTDHHLVWADIILPLSTPNPLEEGEGAKPQGLLPKKTVPLSAWVSYTEGVEAKVPITVPHIQTTVEEDWRILKNAIIHSADRPGPTGVTRGQRQRLHKKPKHPVTVFPEEKEATDLKLLLQHWRNLLHQGTITPPHPTATTLEDSEESLWLTLLTQVNTGSKSYHWPKEYRDPTGQPPHPTWWQWASTRLGKLHRIVGNLRRQMKRQRLRAAITKRCEQMQTHLSQSLASILDRGRETSTAQVIKKDSPTGLSYLTAWPEVEEELCDIFHRWTATRNPQVHTLRTDPLWAEIYQPTPPHLSPLGTLGHKLTMPELEEVLADTPGGKASGPTGISYELLSKLGTKARVFLLSVLNKALSTATVPQEWLSHIILPIPKGPWTQDYNATRPIALLETPRKILEQLINKRIRKVLQENPNILQGGNYGFVPGDGIDGALTTIREVIQDAQEEDRELWVAQQDIRRAYDTVSWPSLEASLVRVGMDPVIIALLHNMWQSRTAAVTTDRGFTKHIKVENGLAQGGVLSPIMWVFFYDPLLTAIKNQGGGYQIAHSKYLPGRPPTPVTAVAFADDTTWMAPNREAMQATFNLAATYLTAHDLESHPGKFTLVARGINQEAPPLVFGTTRDGNSAHIHLSPPDEPIRILGVLFSIGKPTQANNVKILQTTLDVTNRLLRKGVTTAQIRYIANHVIYPAIHFIAKGTHLNPVTLAKCEVAWRRLIRAKSKLPRAALTEFIHHPTLGGLLRVTDSTFITTAMDTLGLLNSQTPAGHISRYRLQLTSERSGWAETVTSNPPQRLYLIGGRRAHNHWSALGTALHMRAISIIPTNPKHWTPSTGPTIPTQVDNTNPMQPYPIRGLFGDLAFARRIAPHTATRDIMYIHQLTNQTGERLLSKTLAFPDPTMHTRTKNTCYDAITEALQIHNSDRLPGLLHQPRVARPQHHQIPHWILDPSHLVGSIVAEFIGDPEEGNLAYELYEVVASVASRGVNWTKVVHYRETTPEERIAWDIIGGDERAFYRTCDGGSPGDNSTCFNTRTATGWNLATQEETEGPFYPDQPQDKDPLDHKCIGWSPKSDLHQVTQWTDKSTYTIYRANRAPRLQQRAPVEEETLTVLVIVNPDSDEDPILQQAKDFFNEPPPAQPARQLEDGPPGREEPIGAHDHPQHPPREPTQGELWRSSSRWESAALTYSTFTKANTVSQTPTLAEEQTRQEWATIIAATHRPGEPVTVYSDGSLQHYPAGAKGGGGVILDLPNQEEVVSATMRLPVSWSSRQGEIGGVALALYLVPPHRELTIILDDQGLVNSWATYVQGPKKARQLSNILDIDQWGAIQTLMRNRPGKVTLEWIRGHGEGNTRGERRNNQADLAAKASLLTNPTQLPIAYNQVPYRMGILNVLLPGRTTRVLKQLHQETSANRLRHHRQTALLMDERITKMELHSRSLQAITVVTTPEQAHYIHRRIKMALGLLPTLARLHRDMPQSYLDPYCPLCQAPETQLHLFTCPERDTTAPIFQAKLRRALHPTLSKSQFNNMCDNLPWLQGPTGPTLGRATNEDQHWLSRGLCPRSFLQQPQVKALPAKEAKALISKLSETIVDAFTDLIWTPRQPLVPHHQPVRIPFVMEPRGEDDLDPDHPPLGPPATPATPQTPNLENPPDHEPQEGNPPVEEARPLIPLLQRRACQICSYNHPTHDHCRPLHLARLEAAQKIRQSLSTTT